MAIKRRENKFRGMDLNETNVKAIFNDCIATESTQNTLGICLFTKKMRI